MYARLFSDAASTIFPKSESVNTKTRQACVHLNAMTFDLERHKKEKLVPLFFPSNEMRGAF
jgi:hypothetical protein